MAFLNDTFTGTAGTALTSHTGETGATWTMLSSLTFSANTAVLTNANAVRTNGSANVAYIASGVPSHPDYSVEAIVEVLTSVAGGVASVVARCDGVFDCYYLGFTAAGMSLTRFMAAGAGSAALDTHDDVFGAGTYTIRLDVWGTSIRGFLNGVQVLSGVDSNITATGKAGIALASDAAESNTTGIHIRSVTATEFTEDEFLSDTFTDAAGTALTAHAADSGSTWTRFTSATFNANTAVISSANAVRTNGAGVAYYKASWPTTTPDYYVEAQIEFKTSVAGGYAGVLARGDGVFDSYACYILASGVYLVRFSASAGSLVLGSWMNPFSAGTSTLRLSVSGTALTVAVDGVNRIVSSDSHIAGPGFAGIALSSDAAMTNSTGIHILSVTTGAGVTPPDNPQDGHGTRSLLTINGDATLLYVPLDYDPVAGAPAVILIHGSGGNELSYETNPDGIPLVSAVLDAGYIVIAGNNFGEKWGNAQAVDAVSRQSAYLHSEFNITREIIHAGSMGGLNALNAIDHKRLPGLTGVYLLEPVSSLLNAYNGADGGANFSSGINPAYGISGDYSAKTSGYDPMLASASLVSYWRRLRFAVLLSDDDVTVPRTAHGDLLVAHLAGQVRSLQVIEITGPHGDPSGLDPAPFLAFCDSCTVASSGASTTVIGAGAAAIG